MKNSELKKQNDRKYYRANKLKILKYQKQFYLKNKEHIKKRIKEYSLKNREKVALSKKKNYEKNKDKIKLYKKKWRLKNLQKIKEKAKIYYQKNKNLLNEKHSKYRKLTIIKRRKTYQKYKSQKRKTNKNYALIENLRNRIYYAIKGNNKYKNTQELLGCSIPELKNHLEKQFKEGMNWGNYTYFGWHVDHIKPLSSFNLLDEIQLKEACHYSNLQPLWWKDNLKKSAKI